MKQHIFKLVAYKNVQEMVFKIVTSRNDGEPFLKHKEVFGVLNEF